ncbi:MAG: ribosomal-protein-alanine N-acetyltransferase [Phenylobacterium sp.]|jgi:ribosomal-protein-alanine N-acetyltransferase
MANNSIPADDIIALSTNLVLQTERLTIRRFKSTDLAYEKTQHQNSEVMKFIRKPLTDEQSLVFFANFIKPYQCQDGEWFGLCVTLKDAPDVNVGAISFRFEAFDFGIVEIGYRFDSKHQGKGYATEAVTALVDFVFNRLQVHKVIAYCDVLNTASFKIMEKLGMQREGLLRQSYQIGELFSDTLVYGLLRDEWPEQ